MNMPISDDPGQLGSRYSRQVLFEHMGPAAQARLAAGRATLIGCGALGTVLADTLARAGLGFLRLVDRDYVELNNLQRQVLFDEADAADGAPKAVAAAQKLARINSRVQVEPVVADATAENIEGLIEGAAVILDGSDNFETRFLINDAAVKHSIPWVYGACVGAEGMMMPIVPRRTPCLRCIWDQPPPPGVSPTCDTAGILAAIVHIVASLQAVEAIKILIGRQDLLCNRLVQINAWAGQFDTFDLQGAYDGKNCTCCGRGEYEHLAARGGGRTVTLCGRDAVQVGSPPGSQVDFAQVAARVAPGAKSAPRFNRYLLRFAVDKYEITLFRDGRAIIKGASTPEEGRSIYARYIGA